MTNAPLHYWIKLTPINGGDNIGMRMIKDGLADVVRVERGGPALVAVLALPLAVDVAVRRRGPPEIAAVIFELSR